MKYKKLLKNIKDDDLEVAIALMLEKAREHSMANQNGYFSRTYNKYRAEGLPHIACALLVNEAIEHNYNAEDNILNNYKQFTEAGISPIPAAMMAADSYKYNYGKESFLRNMIELKTEIMEAEKKEIEIPFLDQQKLLNYIIRQ